jgi:hypothetical protein
MSLNNPSAGFNFAAEFQSSGLPWVTSSVAPAAGSPDRFDFPLVTRFITVANLATATNTLSFGFTQSGVKNTNNKFIVNPNQTVTVEIKTNRIWLQGENGTPSFSIIAGLTTVQSSEMPYLSGTLSDGSTGWIGIG